MRYRRAIVSGMEDDENATIDLLLKALDGLPAGEREQVLRLLVRRGLTAPAAPAWVALGSSAPGTTGFITQPRRGAEQQLVPVRFPTEQHARLREWCGENGYPMAAVVRGLVDRFLDEETARPASAGSITPG